MGSASVAPGFTAPDVNRPVGLLESDSEVADGYVLVTSRASYEMIQKAATLGIRMLVAVSAPTALGVELARDCGLTLVGFAREQQQVIYTHPGRVRPD